MIMHRGALYISNVKSFGPIFGLDWLLGPTGSIHVQEQILGRGSLTRAGADVRGIHGPGRTPSQTQRD